eukprot:scaffold46181_cov96-Attheya_sp.AAC.3
MLYFVLFHSHDKAIVILGHTGPSSSQKLFFDGLEKEARRFKKPILYVHGGTFVRSFLLAVSMY